MLLEAVKRLLERKDLRNVLLLISESELSELKEAGLPVNDTDTSLSMQHLRFAELAVARLYNKVNVMQLLAVTPQTAVVLPQESALIYAMLIRCRKVISCRDKLDNMMKDVYHQEWSAIKAEYETKVLDLYKATWRDEFIYPYNIVDNIKEYNKNESYILKQLYWHLAERIPGNVNAGDMLMLQQLRIMFSDLSVSLMRPQTVVAGNIAGDKQLEILSQSYRNDNAVQFIEI